MSGCSLTVTGGSSGRATRRRTEARSSVASKKIPLIAPLRPCCRDRAKNADGRASLAYDIRYAPRAATRVPTSRDRADSAPARRRSELAVGALGADRRDLGPARARAGSFLVRLGPA